MKIKHIPDIIVILLAVIFFAEFFAVAYFTFLNGGYSGFDLGKNNQSMWLLSHFRYPFNTIMGMNTFGDHMHLVFIFLIPFYLLWQTPACLLFINIAFRSIGIYIAYLLAKKILNNIPLAVFFALLLAINPEYGNASIDHFYPEELAPPLILAAFYFILKENPIWFFASLFLIASVKEDAPSISFMITALFLVKNIKSYKTNKKIITITVLFLVFLAAYFLISVRVISALSNNQRGFSDGRVFGSLLANLFNWDFYKTQLTAPETSKYIDSILGPFGYTPILSPDIFILCAPSFIFNILTPWPYARNITFHYSVYITPILLVSVMYLFNRIISLQKTLKIKNAIAYPIIVILASFILYNALLYNSSLSKVPIYNYPHNIQDNIEWYNTDQERIDFETAAKLIPPYANVSSDVFLVTRLTNRPYIYQYTNPWKSLYWGNPGDDKPADNRTIQYIIVKYSLLSGYDKSLIDNMTLKNEFKIAYKSENAQIMLLQRVK